MIQAYLKKIETFQLNNLTLHLQELEEQQKQSPEQVEGRKQPQSEQNKTIWRLKQQSK